MAFIETFSNISCLSLWIINIYYSYIFWNQFCFLHNITLFYFRYAKAPETDFRRYRYFVRVCPRLTNQTFLEVSTNANLNVFKMRLWKKLGVYSGYMGTHLKSYESFHSKHFAPRYPKLGTFENRDAISFWYFPIFNPLSIETKFINPSYVIKFVKYMYVRFDK